MSHSGKGDAQYNRVMNKMAGRYVHQKETTKINSRSTASRNDARRLRNDCDIGAVRYESSHQFQAYNKKIQDTLDMASNLRSTLSQQHEDKKKESTGNAAGTKEGNKTEDRK